MSPVMRLARTGPGYTVAVKRDGQMVTEYSRTSFEDAEAKLAAKERG